MTPFHAAYVRKLASDGPVADALPRGRAVADLEPYFYNVAFSGLVSGTAQQAVVPTQADSDFVLTSMSAIGYDSVGVLINRLPDVYWQITDQASGKRFFNVPLASLLVAGCSGEPAALSIPRLILANSTLAVAVTPYSNLQTDVWLSLCGVRVYYED